MEQETVTFKLPMIQVDILFCILFGLGRMFRSLPAVKLGMIVCPNTISLGVFVGKRCMAFLSLRGFGVGISQSIILTRMMDFDDRDFAVHSFSMALNEGRLPRLPELCASRVLSKGPPRPDMFGEILVLAIPTDSQCANFFKKNKPFPLPRLGIAANTIFKEINFFLSQVPKEYKSSETGIRLSVIVKPLKGILFRIRENPFGLATSKYHLPQLRGERQKLLATREKHCWTILARC